MATRDFDSAMTKMIKPLVSVLGDVTSARIKLLAVDMRQSKQEIAACLKPKKIRASDTNV